MTVLDPSGISTDAARQALALRLWSLVHPRAHGFTHASAARVAQSLNPTSFRDTKALARCLREALATERVRLKHTSALKIAAALQFGASWHRVAARPPTHRLLWLLGDLREEEVCGHGELAARLLACCNDWYRETSTRLFRVHVDAEALTVESGLAVGSNPRRPLYPILIARPIYIQSNWLVQAHRMLELLRRRLEETGIAIVDGVAAMQFYRSVPLQRTDDVKLFKPELVLMLQDESGGNVQVARGSEMACWSKLESNAEGLGHSIELDNDAWRLGPRRYVWELTSGCSTDTTVGPLGQNEVRRLLRRYRMAKSILCGSSYFVLRQNKFIDCTQQSVCHVDLAALLRLIHNSGESWDSCCLRIGRQVEQSSPLPKDFLLHTLERLSFADPNPVLGMQLRLRPLREHGDAPPSAHFTEIDHVTLRLARSCYGSLRKALKGAAGIINDSFVAEAAQPANKYLGQADPESSRRWRAEILGNTLGALEEALQRRGLVIYRGALPRFVHIRTDTSNAVAVREFILTHSEYLDIRPERTRERRSRARKRIGTVAGSSTNAI